MKSREEMIKEIKEDIDSWSREELLDWAQEFMDFHLASCDDEQLEMEYLQFFGMSDGSCSGECAECSCSSDDEDDNKTNYGDN